jgi:hypothetical protein
VHQSPGRGGGWLLDGIAEAFTGVRSALVSTHTSPSCKNQIYRPIHYIHPLKGTQRWAGVSLSLDALRIVFVGMHAVDVGVMCGDISVKISRLCAAQIKSRPGPSKESVRRPSRFPACWCIVPGRSSSCWCKSSTCPTSLRCRKSCTASEDCVSCTSRAIRSASLI